MTITENDFIEKMIDIAKTGYESMIQLQCVFFTWNEFFNTKEDACRAFEVASQIFSAAHPRSTLERNQRFLERTCLLPIKNNGDTAHSALYLRYFYVIYSFAKISYILLRSLSLNN